MFYFLAFLAGLIIGDVTTKKPKVVVVENGNIVEEFKSEGHVMVIKDQEKVELRKSRPDQPVVMKKVVTRPFKFYRDIYGEITAGCVTCYEDMDVGADETVWDSKSAAAEAPAEKTQVSDGKGK